MTFLLHWENIISRSVLFAVEQWQPQPGFIRTVSVFSVTFSRGSTNRVTPPSPEVDGRLASLVQGLLPRPFASCHREGLCVLLGGRHGSSRLLRGHNGLVAVSTHPPRPASLAPAHVAASQTQGSWHRESLQGAGRGEEPGQLVSSPWPPQVAFEWVSTVVKEASRGSLSFP